MAHFCTAPRQQPGSGSSYRYGLLICLAEGGREGWREGGLGEREEKREGDYLPFLFYFGATFSPNAAKTNHLSCVGVCVCVCARTCARVSKPLRKLKKRGYL